MDNTNTQTQIEQLSPSELLTLIAEAISLDPEDIALIRQSGGGMRLGIKDTLRQVVVSVYTDLTQQADAQDFESLIEQVDPEAAAALLQEILSNWLNSLEYSNTYTYLLNLFTTQLGEALTYDPDIVASAELAPDLKERLQDFLAAGHQLQQREFGGYTLGLNNLPGLIASAKRRCQVPGASQRELDELAHLEFLYSQLNNQTLGNLIEISPPWHGHQTQTMLRIYTHNPSGWHTTIFYLPHVDLPLEEIVSQYLTSLKLDGTLLHSALASKSLRLLGTERQLNADYLAEHFPLVTRMGGLGVIRSGDKAIAPHLDKVMPQATSIITDLINTIPAMVTTPGLLNRQAARLERVLHAVNVSTRTPSQLAAVGHNEVDIQQIIAGDLLEKATELSATELDVHVAKNYSRPITSQLESDCTHSAQTFGVNSFGLPNSTTNQTVIGRDGTTIQFIDQNGTKYLKNCPMCGHALLDICGRCEGCGREAAQMRRWFEEGTLARHKEGRLAAQAHPVGSEPPYTTAPQHTANKTPAPDRVFNFMAGPVRNLMNIVIPT